MVVYDDQGEPRHSDTAHQGPRPRGHILHPEVHLQARGDAALEAHDSGRTSQGAHVHLSSQHLGRPTYDPADLPLILLTLLLGVYPSFITADYNKIESHREVGVPEAISHLLGYPDRYSNMIFENINTSQLWLYVTRLQQAHDQHDVAGNSRLHSQIIDADGGLILLSPFDDYRFRGEALAQYSLYDYRSVIYKRKQKSGLQFSVDHPQHSTHSQLCRQTVGVTPSLTGDLFHLRGNSSDPKVREKFFGILTALFVPWHGDVPLRSATDSWEAHFQAQSPLLSSRICRYIFNVDLLHRSKEESEFDRMQRDARQGPSLGLDPMLDLHDSEYEYQDEDDSVLSPLITTVKDSLELGDDSMDFYTHEAIDACHDSGFFDAPMPDIIPDSFPFLRKADVAAAFKSLDDHDDLRSAPTHSDSFPSILPSVSISDIDGERDGASSIANAFSLNVEQRRAFDLVVYHSLHHSGLPDYLLMGVFGEAGTGKTRVIKAIQA